MKFSNANEIKKLVYDTIGYKTDAEFTVIDKDDVYAEGKNGKFTVHQVQ